MSPDRKTESFPTNARARDWVSGFFVLGVLTGAIGPLLIAWQYHIDSNPRLIGLHFLALNAGYVIAVAVAQRQLTRTPIRYVALRGCGVGFLSLLALSFLVPPVAAGWRMLVLACMGFAGGSISTSLLYVLEPFFSRSTARAVNLTGALFGFGCAMATGVVGATYFTGSLALETRLLAIVPLTLFLLLRRNRFPPALRPFSPHEVKNGRPNVIRDLGQKASVLFSLMLFFQSGNEWIIAGWLPIFLIHRLGANPVWAIGALAAYFLSLTVGRVAARPLIPRVSHRKLLVGGTGTAMAGYVLLSLTPTMVGAWVAVIAIGVAFAPTYPLLAEILDDRFSYHPGFYNGLFSIAFTGAMSSPWLISYVDALLGTQYVMVVPAFGSIAVLVLTLLMMYEARLAADSKEKEPLVMMKAAGR